MVPQEEGVRPFLDVLFFYPVRVVPGSLALMVITLGPCFLNRLSSHHLWLDPMLRSS